MPPPEVEAIFAKIRALSRSDRLRLAAGMLEQGLAKLAEPVIERVAAELQAERIFKRPFTGMDDLP